MANYLKIKIEKMIISEHVLFEAQFKNSVILWKRHVPFFGYLIFIFQFIP